MKIFSCALIAACGMGIQLSHERPRGPAGEDREGGQCDWRQAVGFLADALDYDESGTLDADDWGTGYYSDLARIFENNSEEAQTIEDVLTKAVEANGGSITAEELVDFFDGLIEGGLYTEAEAAAAVCWF